MTVLNIQQTLVGVGKPCSIFMVYHLKHIDHPNNAFNFLPMDPNLTLRNPLGFLKHHLSGEDDPYPVPSQGTMIMSRKLRSLLDPHHQSKTKTKK